MPITEFLEGRYERTEPIGDGAEARVHKCTNGERVTAVKIVETTDTALRARFEREVETILRVEHENVVAILDFGHCDGFSWYEMEYADQGHFGTMAGYLFYSDLDRVSCLRQICSGVQALHESEPRIIHSDLKPSNILVFGREGHDLPILKIADFGAATLAADRHPPLGNVGTALYMAPERLEHPEVASVLTDIYSLGILFLEACTGRTRPSDENLNLVPELVRPIVHRMVRENPAERYQSVTEIVEELNGFTVARLMFGRELQPGDEATIWHANAGRYVENAFGSLAEADVETILDRLAAFQQSLDSLGDAHDDVADWIMKIPGEVIGRIEEADRNSGNAGEAGFELVRRFVNDAARTTEHDYSPPRPDNWSRFLAETFRYSSYRSTRHLCLDGLVTYLVRFGTPWTKNYLYLTITGIDDPFEMAELAEYLRRAGREDVARLLDGVPENRSLDEAALRGALAG